MGNNRRIDNSLILRNVAEEKSLGIKTLNPTNEPLRQPSKKPININTLSKGENPPRRY